MEVVCLRQSRSAPDVVNTTKRAHMLDIDGVSYLVDGPMVQGGLAILFKGASRRFQGASNRGITMMDVDAAALHIQAARLKGGM